MGARWGRAVGWVVGWAEPGARVEVWVEAWVVAWAATWTVVMIDEWMVGGTGGGGTWVAGTGAEETWVEETWVAGTGAEETWVGEIWVGEREVAGGARVAGTAAGRSPPSVTLMNRVQPRSSSYYPDASRCLIISKTR